MTMTLEKNRAEFEGLGEVESCESETPQGFAASWGKEKWSTIDAGGNCVNDGSRSYQWDAANRLVQINVLNPQPPTVTDTIQFQYDGQGRRVAITEKHGSTVLTAKTFVWCGNGLCEERDGTGHTVAKRFYGIGEQINGTPYFWSFDHLGNVREITDSSGNVRARYDYSPYGRQTKLSGDLDADFGFTGMYVNKTTGLNLTWYRAYDPERGRWLSRDPEGEFAGLNLYDYAVNDPAMFTDQLGLSIWICSRSTFGGIANHAYLWDDSTNTCCARDRSSGSSGSGSSQSSSSSGAVGSCSEKGPFGGDSCNLVDGSNGKESAVMKCCKEHANDGLWVPGINDCHNAANDCITKAGLASPGAPGGRFGSRTKCGCSGDPASGPVNIR